MSARKPKSKKSMLSIPVALNPGSFSFPEGEEVIDINVTKLLKSHKNPARITVNLTIFGQLYPVQLSRQPRFPF